MHTDDETPTMTETRFRELLAAEGLAEPDAIERRSDELVFLWHDQKLAVVVELENEPPSSTLPESSPSSSATRSRRDGGSTTSRTPTPHAAGPECPG
jgi:hypothetical protein